MDAIHAGFPGNVLKSHGRNYSVILFVRLKKPTEDVGGECLRKHFVNWMESPGFSITYHQDQLVQKEQKDKSGDYKLSFITMGISRRGFNWLKVQQNLIPKDRIEKYFENPMLELTIGGDFWSYSGGDVEDNSNDGEITGQKKFKLDKNFEIRSGGIHLAFLIANDDREQMYRSLQKICTATGFNECVDSYFLEFGEKGENGAGPLGFKDNISNEDKASRIFEMTNVSGHESLRSNSGSIGTFMVYQKIRVDNESFESLVSQIKNKIVFPDGTEKRFGYTKRQHAEAYLIGRFKDGRPLVLADNGDNYEKQDFNYYQNNFTYSRKSKCPVAAHVRAANPRNRKSVLSQDQHAGIIRRGVNFEYLSIGKIPNVSGLHFISYQSSVSELAIIMKRMRRLASGGPDAAFYRLSTKRDKARFPITWGESGEFEIPLNGEDVSQLLGGEIFFMPSREYFEEILSLLQFQEVDIA